ncbi:MAG: hypothetical protein JWR02_1091 [Mucilaginibacter sp.]|nr:hypothetical protein [Mucilaginibacter sp.]
MNESENQQQNNNLSLRGTKQSRTVHNRPVKFAIASSFLLAMTILNGL